MEKKRYTRFVLKIFAAMCIVLTTSIAALAEQTGQNSAIAVNHTNAVIAAIVMLLFGVVVFMIRHKKIGGVKR